jgi:hypothetical protein
MNRVSVGGVVLFGGVFVNFFFNQLFAFKACNGGKTFFEKARFGVKLVNGFNRNNGTNQFIQQSHDRIL